MVVLSICRPAQKCGAVLGLAAAEEKNTEATTDLISISMPALAAACLTMAWFFWRGALIEVWKRNFSRLPSLARRPSPPRFQPAAARTWLARSTLNSHRVFLEKNRVGAFRNFAVVCPPRP